MNTTAEVALCFLALALLLLIGALFSGQLAALLHRVRPRDWHHGLPEAPADPSATEQMRRQQDTPTSRRHLHSPGDTHEPRD